MGLTFLNAGFLFAALAALLPLVIHLISRRRVAVVDFSSLRFLRELERKKIRRVRLRQILLLIIRSLIILCVALALARPTLRGALAAGSRAHARTSVAIVLDTSASMGRGDGATLAQEARNAAVAVAGLLDEGDQAFLLDADGDEVIPGGTFSGDALVAAIEASGEPGGGTDYQSAVASAARLLEEARNINREIYVVGDMQLAGWTRTGLESVAEPGGEPDADAPGATTSSPDAPAGGPPVFVLSLSGPEANAGVTRVSVSRKYGGDPGLHGVSSEITNAGAREIDVPVRLYVDGVHVGQSGTSAPAGGAGEAAFTVSVDPSEWHFGRVEIADDALAADNVRHFVVPPVSKPEVLVVGPDGGGGSDDGYYIARALDPSGASGVPVARIFASELRHQERGRFAVVVLADTGRLDEDGAAWLAEHLQTGGGLLVVFGDRTDVRWWNAGSLSDAAGVKLLGTFERRAGVRLAPASPGHPLLAGLVSGDRLIDEIAFRRGFTVELAGANAVLEFPGVGPALVEVPSPGGATACLLAGVDADWGDLPGSGLMVPLAHRLAESLGGGPRGATAAVVGDELFLPADSGVGRFQLVRPDSSAEMVDITERVHSGVTVEADARGIYRLTRDGRTVWASAVGLPPSESRLRRADHDEISSALAPREPRFMDDTSRLAEFILGSRRGRELWRVLVYIALALLALELYVARSRI